MSVGKSQAFLFLEGGVIMTEKTLGNEDVPMEPLSTFLFELDAAEQYLEDCEQGGNLSPNIGLLRLLLRGLKEKIDYYQDAYGFEVPESDGFFYVEDLPDFIRKKEGIDRSTCEVQS